MAPARDPFLDMALKPAEDLTETEQQFLLENSFHAHPPRMIYRYPRYGELWAMFRGAGYDAIRAERMFQMQDYSDLQVLSQLAWWSK